MYAKFHLFSHQAERIREAEVNFLGWKNLESYTVPATEISNFPSDARYHLDDISVTYCYMLLYIGVYHPDAVYH